ncbi:hypothetical protein AWH56_26850 [Anaerobacillus isosaccharinicus]|uniref:Uncharacterized protein n=1 Tax=Anaerobacillus isosaccharinicus TaxID=1532552 RepID=A0AC62A4E6_9BACI
MQKFFDEIEHENGAIQSKQLQSDFLRIKKYIMRHSSKKQEFFQKLQSKEVSDIR